MASTQCHKPADETSQQKCADNHSLGHKISEITGGWFKGNNHDSSHHQTHCTTPTPTPCPSQAKPTHNHTTHSVDKTKGDSDHHPDNASNGVACQGRTAKKRNLFQKIKDGLSGNDSSSDSSSDESDNEGCRKRKD